MRRAKIYCFNRLAGYLQEDESGFSFTYHADYLQEIDAVPVSLTLPLQAEPYRSSQLFPFFDGLIPEGWLLNVAQENWKLNPRDRMGLLLACRKECIGAVSVQKEDE